MPTRRTFLRQGLILVTMGAAAPAFLARTGVTTQTSVPANTDVPTAVPAAVNTRASRRSLVVVQLSGGNDGLNTVIPYADALYREFRPQLAVPEAEVLPLDDAVGLHPALAPLQARFESGQLAVVLGVGYPNPDRSHFRSMDIWQTAEPSAYATQGWLGRYLAGCACGDHGQAPAISLGQTLPRAFWTESLSVPSFSNLDGYRLQPDPYWPADHDARRRALEALEARHEALRPYAEFLGSQSLNALASVDALQRVAGSWISPVDYPDNAFAQSLELIAQVVAGDLGTRLFYVQLGGFDTHANQRNTHQRLLEMLAGGLEAFQRDLETMGKADQVLTMTFSEFGRRVRENGSQGTDHGTAEPMFVLGSSLAGGLYGRQPPLDDLDNGDLRYQIDFRAVYATVLERWLGASPEPVLGTSYTPVDFLA
jgi:uncharacterized protein (DUF1501 family)